MGEFPAHVVPWLVFAAIVVMSVRQLPRVIRDSKGPIPDVGDAPDDAEPMALFMPNDDGLFTWDLWLPETPRPDAGPHEPGSASRAPGPRRGGGGRPG